MAGIRVDYLGMPLSLDASDVENLAFFEHCARHDFHLQRSPKSGLVRYPPTTACPWSGERDYVWQRVEGRGVVYSYTEVHQAIQPAFRDFLPYLVLLVELDTQKGQPSEHEALRVMGNLCTPDGKLAPPEMVRKIGIGSRMRMVFTDLAPGLSLPQWTLDETAPQPAKPWRYPQE